MVPLSLSLSRGQVSGAGGGCSHPVAWPPRPRVKNLLERQASACSPFFPPVFFLFLRGQVLELLKVAWKRRLIFTVGTSSTTGETDTVVWNEIHHKTEMDRNVTGHGYPDPNYLQNVLAELAAQGVTEDCLEQQ